MFKLQVFCYFVLISVIYCAGTKKPETKQLNNTKPSFNNFINKVEKLLYNLANTTTSRRGRVEDDELLGEKPFSFSRHLIDPFSPFEPMKAATTTSTATKEDRHLGLNQATPIFNSNYPNQSGFQSPNPTVWPGQPGTAPYVPFSALGATSTLTRLLTFANVVWNAFVLVFDLVTNGI